ncbi:PEST proteolytic signal-containing nuclear protein-like isoform X3 [Gracilinanus agilis]|uniref:PEST proteolytic signal-containing nuclear protein-like isoform X3 n=1 Tax=Gracilinanus agilis TaxID=191870 RepID=UPI001CFE710C|nr:PEST proteolytic signal-containing nuclear protein-like isoform X3 [Gracilinanus agilis]
MVDGKAGEKLEKPQQAGSARGPEEEAEKPVKTKTVSSSNGRENLSHSAEKRSAEETKDFSSKPVPAKIAKFGFAIVAAVFNEDDDSEPEEMPPEAKMRMKNIGRDTPTLAGPNSFNKGKHGFLDNQKLWKRNIKSHLGNVHDQDDD